MVEFGHHRYRVPRFRSVSRARDRLEKRLAYQKLASLREYVLVAQNRLRVEVCSRLDDGWQRQTYSDGERVCLASVGLDLPIGQLYEDVIGYTGGR